MPDRFDLSSPADLESSLQHAVTYCRVVNPRRVTDAQRRQLLVCRTWLGIHQVVVDRWVAGTLNGIDASVDTLPELVEDPVDTPGLLASFAERVRLLTPATIALSHRRDTQNLTTRSGTVAALDIARPSYASRASPPSTRAGHGRSQQPQADGLTPEAWSGGRPGAR